MKLVAIKDAKLYREIHAYAIEVFEQAKKYYHVTTQIDRIPDLDSLDDSELPNLFNHNDSRQLIHITYGLILNAKNPDDSSRFHDRLYKLWNEHGDAYAQLLEQHIGKHLELLYKNW